MTTDSVFARMRVRDWIGVAVVTVPPLPVVLFVALAVGVDGTSVSSAIGWYMWFLPGSLAVGLVLLAIVYLAGYVWDLRAGPGGVHRYTSEPTQAQDEVSQ